MICPSVLIYRNEKDKVEELTMAAPPLGGIRNYEYSSLRKTVNQGDVILLQTDGFIERQNSKDEMLGYEQTTEIFKSAANNSAKVIIEKMIHFGKEWAENNKPDDDITMMAIKIK